MATDFQASQWVPSYSTDAARGGGPAAIFVQTLDDFSAIYTGAKWDLLAMFTKKDYDFGSQGGGEKPLDLELVDGDKITLDDQSGSTSNLTKKITFTTARESAVMMEFLDSVKGKKYFIVDLVSRQGTTKNVFFGFGFFELSLKRSSQYSQAVSYDIVFNVKADGLASRPTLPTLPVNTDSVFTTGEMNMQYLGWLLAAADATKGGYGNIVALPTTSVLHKDKCGVTVAI